MLILAISLLLVSFTHTLQAAGVPPDASREAWTVLDQALQEGSADRRREALAAIATIGQPDPEAVKRAESALQDKDVLVRADAALALGALKAGDAIPYLKQALQDAGEVAFAAAKSLTELGDPSGREVLIAVVAGERKDIQPGMMTNAMRKVKGDLKHPEGIVLVGAQDATGAMFGPVSAVFPAVKNTVDLKSKGAVGRAAATEVFAMDPDPYAVSLLEWALNDDSEQVKLAAARALGERGNTGSLDKMEPLLAQSHGLLCDVVAASMIRIVDRDGQPGEPSDKPVLPQTKPKRK